MWEDRHSRFLTSVEIRFWNEKFGKLADLVRSPLEKKGTQLRNAIPTEKQVAVALWRLSTGNSFCVISKAFAIGKSTTVTITREFCTEIFRLFPQFIKFPISVLETVKAIDNFKQDCDCKISQILGAIDDTHIFIQTPQNEQKYDY